MNLQAEILEDWLAAHPPRNRQGRLLDIGAYRGDFSLACLAQALASSADLFEPNPDNHARLERICRQHPNLNLHKIALGSAPGIRDFFCTQDTATGSVLPYQDAAASRGVKPVAHRVPLQTLDQWWQEQEQPPIALLKIDTQGHDLEVLHGGAALVAQQRPWIVIELIFAPLYVGQARPAALLTWAETANYDLAGIFNEHRTEAGLIAFADAVLIPRELTPPLSTHFPARPACAILEQEIAQLHRVCAERLALINSLHAEAEKRLRIIEQLSGHGRPAGTA